MSTTKFNNFIRRAIGVPFIEHGRDFDGWDCGGLVIVAYREVLGIDLPDAADYSTSNVWSLMRLFDARTGGYWQPVDPAPMAVAAIFRRGHIIHTGLLVPGRRILHVERGVETCLEPLASFRIEGFYAPRCCNPPVQGRDN